MPMTTIDLLVGQALAELTPRLDESADIAAIEDLLRETILDLILSQPKMIHFTAELAAHRVERTTWYRTRNQAQPLAA